MESMFLEIAVTEREMDRRLLEVAINGNTMELHQLLQEDSRILDREMSKCEKEGKDNPLHIAALYGHIDFATEILRLKWDFTRRLNSQGQSPLHLASERGHVEVVKEILSKNSDACFIRDQDGMIPVHLAAIKGRVQVLETLVEAKKITAFILTKKGEPILHLCANNNRFEALRKLVELVTDDKFLNLKDSDDNTILHVLSAKNRSELIRLLVQNGTVDVNAVNIDGSMPLDVSIGKSPGPVGLTTAYNLIGAGAKRSVPIFKIGQDWMIGGWFNEALLVVAILMVTVAFQAGINPPGGVWQDTGYHNATLPNAPQPSPPKLVHHYAGQSVMSHLDPKRYKIFSGLNDVTLLYSILVIVLLLKECFVKSSFYKLLAVFSTFISVCTMWAAYVVSLPYISTEVSESPILSVVLFLSMVLVVIICHPGFHVVLYETFGWAPGHRRTTSVQARAVGRP